jgi:predicted DNA binding CopG/RHH family protein
MAALKTEINPQDNEDENENENDVEDVGAENHSGEAGKKKRKKKKKKKTGKCNLRQEYWPRT